MMAQLARSPLLSAGQSPSHVYGGDLYAEVERFAAVAECIADEERTTSSTATIG